MQLKYKIVSSKIEPKKTHLFLKRSIFFIVCSVIFFSVKELLPIPFFTEDQIEVIEAMVEGMTLTQQILLAGWDYVDFFVFYLLVLLFEKRTGMDRRPIKLGHNKHSGKKVN